MKFTAWQTSRAVYYRAAPAVCDRAGRHPHRTGDTGAVQVPAQRRGAQEKTVLRKPLGEALRARRTRCRMTQEFVADSLGVSRQAVSKWESGVFHS